MLARTQLLRIQRSMYDRLRDYAREFLGGLGPELKKYFLEYQRDFNDYQAVSNKHELIAALQKSQIVFCGDYHTLAQAQRTVIRLLRDAAPRLKSRKKKLILALEMVRPVDNKHIESYLSGRLSETEFLKKIGFQRNWGFNWENYRSLFQFAKEHKISIVGLNRSQAQGGSPRLAARDRFASKLIAQLAKKEPSAVIFVLIGDLHLAQNHLPKAVSIQLKKQEITRRLLTIHQNNERLYWKLAAAALEQKVDVVKLKENVFCVLNTPPWVKLQSHLKWTELITEQPEVPALMAEEGKLALLDEIFSEMEYSDEIRDLLGMLRTFLQMPGDKEDDFSVYGSPDQSFMGGLRRKKQFDPAEIKALTLYLNNFKSHFIPKANVFYFSTLNLNHAASQAAIYLHSQLSGFDKVFLSPNESFYAFVWVEALAFLGSKIINPNRKCNGRADFERLIKKEERPSNRLLKTNVEVAKFVCEHLDLETKTIAEGKRFAIKIPKVRELKGTGREKTLFYYKPAKLLGHLLGHALYTGVIKDEVSRAEIRHLFSQPFHRGTPQSLRALYFTWVKRLDRFGYRDVAKHSTL